MKPKTPSPGRQALQAAIKQLHEARSLLLNVGIQARFDLVVADDGPKVYANVGDDDFETAKNLLPSTLNHVTLRTK